MRRKFGLTQKELGFVLGFKSGCKISALEHGHARPSIKESVIFSIFFNLPFEQLWPDWTQRIEIDLDTRIRKLVDQLQRSQVGSSRRNRRVDFALRELEKFLDGFSRN
jgi:transcriptional regulator with XRE-family HTH domain